MTGIAICFSLFLHYYYFFIVYAPSIHSSRTTQLTAHAQFSAWVRSVSLKPKHLLAFQPSHMDGSIVMNRREELLIGRVSRRTHEIPHLASYVYTRHGTSKYNQIGHKSISRRFERLVAITLAVSETMKHASLRRTVDMVNVCSGFECFERPLTQLALIQYGC